MSVAHAWEQSDWIPPDCPTCEDRTEIWIGTEHDTGQPITTDCPDCPDRTST